jgi:hypothetical protein
MCYYVIKHYMNARQHLKMTRETHGMVVRCFYTVYGTTAYQVNEVRTPLIDCFMMIIHHLHIPT